MKNDLFGNIVYEGKIINIDNEKIEVLKEISENLISKNIKLEEKVEKIFNQ